jgi:hypothetical protein
MQYYARGSPGDFSAAEQSPARFCVVLFCMNSGKPVRRYGLVAILALLAMTTPTACAQEVSASSKHTLAVSEPGTSSEVMVPFTVKVKTNVRLGTPETGDFHIHLYFDDNVNHYIVLTSEASQVTDAPAGVHVMHLSLRNANHSAAGVETSIQVTIGSGGTVASTKPSKAASPTPTATDDPYQFDY